MRDDLPGYDMKQLRYILLTLVFTHLIFIGCTKESTSTSSSSSTTTTTSDNGSTSDDSATSDDSTDDSSTSSVDCTADGEGDQSSSYYNLDITAHGLGKGGVVWSSETAPDFQSSDAQNIFVTDSRFNIRVLAHPSPGKTTDSYNKSCVYDALNYSKLKLKIGVRTQGSSSYSDTFTFENVLVDSCSEVHEFSVPQTSDPLVIEVLDAEFDYTCQVYVNSGYDEDDPDLASYCPYWHVPKLDCFQIGIQLSTDYTRDIPH
jgi:hypothetical protein